MQKKKIGVNLDNWYDYKTKTALSLPPAGITCEVALSSGKWHHCKIIGMDNRHVVFKIFNEYRASDIIPGFRPIDWASSN